MPLPPPPPPGPPPPPSFGGGASKGGGDGRGLLLQSIRQGTTLKKAVTNDRSAPLVSGKTTGGNSNSPRSNNTSNTRSNNASHIGGGNNTLGGLFAGGMPKLKPTGGRNGVNSNNNSPSLSTRNEWNSSHSSGSSSSLHQIAAAQKVFPTDVKNRGPPPQPPPATQKPVAPGNSTDTINIGSTISHERSNSASSIRSGFAVPNKAPVGGYGKPNVAPKPPGMLAGNKPNPPPKKLLLNGDRRLSVSRAQSMRSPRSPPVEPPFPPTGKQFGTLRNGGLPSFHQSQDSLNKHRINPPPPPRTATLPSNLNNHGVKQMAPLPPNAPPPPRPNMTPLRPPIVKPPPPPPSRFPGPVNPPLHPPPPPPTSAPPPPIIAPPPPPPPLSAPPPPPHRTTSNAAHCQMHLLQTRTAPAVPSGAPPPPPQRNTSMRNGASPGLSELESKFAERFHLVHEFPPPQTFVGITKYYSSRNVKQQAPIAAKQPAPQPPMLQLSNRMWANNSSNC